VGTGSREENASKSYASADATFRASDFRGRVFQFTKRLRPRDFAA
jgi:hypothetical protein